MDGTSQNTGGRPRKYATAEERTAAKSARQRERRQQQRQQQQAPVPPQQFVFYRPSIPTVPDSSLNATNPRTGLHIEGDLHVPEEPHAGPSGIHHIHGTTEEHVEVVAGPSRTRGVSTPVASVAAPSGMTSGSNTARGETVAAPSSTRGNDRPVAPEGSLPPADPRGAGSGPASWLRMVLNSPESVPDYNAPFPDAHQSDPSDGGMPLNGPDGLSMSPTEAAASPRQESQRQSYRHPSTIPDSEAESAFTDTEGPPVVGGPSRIHRPSVVTEPEPDEPPIVARRSRRPVALVETDSEADEPPVVSRRHRRVVTLIETDSESSSTESGDPDANLDGSAADDSTRRIATLLGTQLVTFHGCTEAQHRKYSAGGDEHNVWHSHHSVSSECHSLRDITNVLQGTAMPTPERDRPRTSRSPRPRSAWSVPSSSDESVIVEPLPDDRRGLKDILGTPLKLRKRKKLGYSDSDAVRARRWQWAFEGTQGSAGATQEPPPRLCLETYYTQEKETAEPYMTSFDIDSICGLATSLVVAKRGIHWFPDMYVGYNIEASVHLGVHVPPPVDAPPEAPWEEAPLHMIPHYAFGMVRGMNNMMIYFVFPRLHRRPARSGNSWRPKKRLTNTVLTADQYSLWYDAVLAPALYETITVDMDENVTSDSNILQYLPQSRRAAAALSRAAIEKLQRATAGDADDDSGTEADQVTTIPGQANFVDGSHQGQANPPHSGAAPRQKQIVQFPLHVRHLGRLTEAMREIIQSNEECSAWFGDFVLYFANKNTKVEHMMSGPIGMALPALCDDFKRQWQDCIDDEATVAGQVFVDLAKQSTSRHTGLPFHSEEDSNVAEVFLFRACCLEQVVRHRQEWAARSSQSKRKRSRPGKKSRTGRRSRGTPETVAERATRLIDRGIQPFDLGDGTRSSASIWAERWKRLRRYLPLGPRANTGSSAALTPAPEGTPEGTPVPEAPCQSEEDVSDDTSESEPEAVEAEEPAGPTAPTVIYYPWAMTSAAGSVTVESAPAGGDRAGGLIYSQFYNIIKAPFDAQKNYVLQPAIYENLALDPTYHKESRQRTKVASASPAVLKKGYDHGKARAHLNLIECTNRSYGVREEHRISLSLLHEIHRQWPTLVSGIATGNDEHDMDSLALPWFAIPTPVVLPFLSAQINRFCLLFETVLDGTGELYSLWETIVMVTALRCLRFCYSSNLVQREPLLFGMDWEQQERIQLNQNATAVPDDDDLPFAEQRRHIGERRANNGLRPDGGASGDARDQFRVTRRSGLGMMTSMAYHGFGWWRPGIFDWTTIRFLPEVGERLLVGNLLLRDEYRRRWLSVRDITSVYVQLAKVGLWYSELKVGLPRSLERLEDERSSAYRLRRDIDVEKRQWRWVECLVWLVLRQFRRDVWEKVLANHQKYPELKPDALARHGTPEKAPAFCWDELFPLFYDRFYNEHTDGTGAYFESSGPYISCGMKNVLFYTNHVASWLFDWGDSYERTGWDNMTYRNMARRVNEMIAGRLGDAAARTAQGLLKELAIYTNPMLPYPSRRSFFTYSKESTTDRVCRRTVWFSSIFRKYGKFDRKTMDDIPGRAVCVCVEPSQKLQDLCVAYKRVPVPLAFRNDRVFHRHKYLYLAVKNYVEGEAGHRGIVPGPVRGGYLDSLAITIYEGSRQIYQDAKRLMEDSIPVSQSIVQDPFIASWAFQVHATVRGEEMYSGRYNGGVCVSQRTLKKMNPREDEHRGRAGVPKFTTRRPARARVIPVVEGGMPPLMPLQKKLAHADYHELRRVIEAYLE